VLIPGLFAIIVIWIGWLYLKPAPPSHVIIATGAKDGFYYAIAQKYADFFADNGITLEVRETAGSGENFQLLMAKRGTTDGGDVDIAIVQGGSAPPADQVKHLRAVAGIYYEPVLVFTRGLDRATQLTQLAGKKIAVGVPGSGVRVLATKLLDEAGVTDKSANSTLLDLGGQQAADALAAGQIDAAIFVISPNAPVVARLLSTPDIHLMSFDQAHAYARIHPFLSATTLYQGAVNIRQNLPNADTDLISSPATIAVRDDTHSAVIELLVRAAEEFNGGTSLLADAGTFPTADRSELLVSKDAKYFLKNPPNFLRRMLPFWLASMVDRLLVLIVPLLVVIIPMFRMIPRLLKWRVQRRFFHRYKRIRQLEERLHASTNPDELRSARDELAAMDKSLATLKIPIGYVEELYNLRTNISYVRSQIDQWLSVHNTSKAGT
jgi:TRAP transporter TAXI family solute receptor